jgi:hypothetical protein
MPRGGSKPGERRGGRQKGSVNKWTDVRRAFAELGPEAADFILTTMRDAAAPLAIRIVAAKEILDRGYGRPAPMVKVGPNATGSWDLSKLTDEQLRLGYEISRAASTGIGDTD